MNLPDNHLDDLFRERLKDFSPEPPPGMWERIQGELDRKRKVRRVIFFRWAGVAAVLLIGIITGILMPPGKDSSPVMTGPGKMVTLPKAVPDSSAANVNPRQVARLVFPPGDEKNGKRNRVSEYREVTPAPPGEEREIFLPVLAGSGELLNRPVTVVPSGSEINLVFIATKETTPALAGPEDTLQKKLPESESSGTEKKRGTPAEWRIGIQLAPAFASRSAGYSASYARNLSSSGSEGQTGVGGGFMVRVRTSGHWMFESGLYYSRSDINQRRNTQLFASNADYFLSTGDKSFYSNPVSVQNGKLTVNSAAGLIRFDEIPEKATLVAGAESAIGMKTILLTSGDFSQVFDFLELPLTARYRIYEGKMDIDLQSGISANFVIGNQVFIVNDSQRDYIGKTSDITGLGFSGIAGLGFNYPLSKKMAITIEPRASYWLNSLNKGGEVTFKPWKIGIYSGLTFGF